MDPRTLFPPLGTDVNVRAKGRYIYIYIYICKSPSFGQIYVILKKITKIRRKLK